MRKNARLLRGEVRAELIGGGTDRLLDACASGGLRLWNVSYENGCTLRASLREDDLPRLERIAALCQCAVDVIELRGGSMNEKRLRARAGLALLAALFALALTISGLFIWDIEIEGNERLSEGEILRALADCGVSEGCFWPAADAERVRSAMLLRCEDLAWMTLNVRASRATVLVLERREKPEIYSEKKSAEIIAARDGVVRELTVKNGRSLVEAGAVVTKGQLLVTGVMDSPTGESRSVRAEGSVMADTWPERVIFLSPGAQQKERSRAFSLALGMKFGKRRVELVTNSRKELDECDKIVKEYVLGIDGLFRFPLGLVVEIYRPYTPAGPARSETEGAEERALAELREEIEGEIVSCEFAEEEDRLVLRANCIENIALTLESEDP